ncbi:hypothetical protein Tco_0073227 [Tanacetum coccineum]
MDDPNITMEEYIRLEEEKAQRHGQTFNWQTATYGKMEYYEDEDTNFKTEYLAIVFDDTDATLSCESTVKNENDKVNMPSFPSPESAISHFDNLDFFQDFENEFPAITYNDNLMSKLTEPSVSFQHIEESDLNNESSLSKYDKEKNVLYSNDSLPLNVVFPKSKKDIDDDKINVTQSSGRHAINIDTKGSDKPLKTGHDMAPLPSRDHRHLWLSLTERIRQALGDRLRMVYTEDMGQELFTSHAGQVPEKVTSVDLFYLRSMEWGTANVSYLLAQYLFRHAEGRKSGARLSRGHFIGCLAAHFGLVSGQGLRGLSVVTCELSLIDLHELGRLNICIRVDDTWAWVAPRPDRQSDAAAGTFGAAEDAPAVDEGA